MKSGEKQVRVNRTTWVLASYAAILYVLRVGLEGSSLGQALGPHLRFAFASFALLVAPLWFFGFGAGNWLRQRLRFRILRIVAPASLGIPYLVFAYGVDHFDASIAAAIFGVPVALAALLELAPRSPKLLWQDTLTLTILAGLYMFKVFAAAWPYPGLAGLPKLYIADIALYLYLILRQLEGVGYRFIPSASALWIGMREWLFFLPFGIGLGFAMHFIHFHPQMPLLTAALTAILVTFLFVAIPEELFFRGILQNLLETRLGTRRALILAALLFGLSHFNKGTALNSRYVLLATIAGIFYGRAWRAQRQLLASVITHTAVDVVWALWFR